MKIRFYATVGGCYTKEETFDSSEMNWDGFSHEEMEEELSLWLTNYLDYGYQVLDEE